jgi:hypothetical protein
MVFAEIDSVVIMKLITIQTKECMYCLQRLIKKSLADSHPTVEHHEALSPKPTDETNSNTADNKTLVIVLHDKEYFYFLPDEKATFSGGEKAFD